MDDRFAFEESVQDASGFIADSIPMVGERPVFPTTPNSANAVLGPMTIEGLMQPAANMPPPPESVLQTCWEMATTAMASGVPITLPIDMARLGVTGAQCKTKP